MTSEPLVSVSAAAREIGVHRSTLQSQVNAGQVRSHEGKVRLSEVLEDRAANIDLTRSRRRAGDGDALPMAPADQTAGQPPADADQPVIVDGKALPYAEARALKETYLARLRQLEFDIKSGEVAAIADVVEHVTADYARVRNKLLSIGALTAPRLAMVRSADEAKAIVDGAVHDALAELSTPDEVARRAGGAM